LGSGIGDSRALAIAPVQAPIIAQHLPIDAQILRGR